MSLRAGEQCEGLPAAAVPGREAGVLGMAVEAEAVSN